MSQIPHFSFQKQQKNKKNKTQQQQQQQQQRKLDWKQTTTQAFHKIV